MPIRDLQQSSNSLTSLWDFGDILHSARAKSYWIRTCRSRERQYCEWYASVRAQDSFKHWREAMLLTSTAWLMD
jgi:hypothetical protein